MGTVSIVLVDAPAAALPISSTTPRCAACMVPWLRAICLVSPNIENKPQVFRESEARQYANEHVDRVHVMSNIGESLPRQHPPYVEEELAKAPVLALSPRGPFRQSVSYP